MLKLLTSFLLASLSLAHTAIAQEKTWEAPYVGSSRDVLYLPDANAVYWRYGWRRENTSSLDGFMIKGQFPQARYFSFNVYDDTTKSSVGSFTDFAVKPDADDANSYTLHIVPQGSPVKGSNVLYFPKGLTSVSVILRHYLAQDTIFGNKPLPQISRIAAGSNASTAATASLPVPKVSKEDIKKYVLPMVRSILANPNASVWDLQAAAAADAGSLTLEQLICKQVVASAFNYNRNDSVLHAYNFDTGGVYPNMDNHYLTMPVTRKKDDALIVKFKAPVYAKSAADNASADVRYFSVSQGDDITRNYATLADKELSVQPDGYVYLLIADESAAVKTKAQSLGINFMPWLVNDKMMLVYRNMLPRSGYTKGVNAVPKFEKSKGEASQRGEKFIGAYAPIGKIVTKDALLSMDKIPTF